MASSATKSGLHLERDEWIRTRIKAALWDNGGCIPETAKQLGMNRTNLYNLMKRLGIDPLRTGNGHRGTWFGLT